MIKLNEVSSCQMRDLRKITMSLGPLIIDLDGISLTSSEKYLLKSRHIGGVIFFSRNFKSISQLISLVFQVRKIKPGILICVDQEGGRVQRFKDGFSQLPPMKILGDLLDTPSENFIKDCGWLMASELIACDIDFSFAPVLDLDIDKCEVIADRSFSQNPILTTRAATLFINGMQEAGMGSTGKHFPGHGGVVSDSHHMTPRDNRNIEDLYVHDLIPFKELANKLDAIMPAHIIYPEIDKNAVCFSKFWLKQVLRKELRFDGVIFSDDLSMKGADIAGDYKNKAKSALDAGCDMILVCNNREGAMEVIEFLESYSWTPPLRLSKMNHRKKISWEELACDNRWRTTKAFLATLLMSQSELKYD